MMIWGSGFKKIHYQTVFDYTFELAVWYPSQCPELPIRYNNYYEGYVAKDGDIAQNIFPVIAFAGGYSQSQYEQAYLAENLARAGFIVVSFSRSEFEKQNGTQGLGYKRCWYRGYEMKLTIQYALKQWEKYIDEKAGIGLLGFSAGGFTSLLLAGAKPQFSRNPLFKIGEQNADNYDFADLIDERVKSIVLMAPIFSEFFDRSALKEVTHPVLLMTAGKDEMIQDKAEKYVEYLPKIVEHWCLENAGHYVFNGTMNSLAQKLFSKSSLDNDVEHALCHSIIVEKTVNFFKQNLSVENI